MPDIDNRENVMILCNSLGGFYDFRGEVAKSLVEKYNVIVCAPDEIGRASCRERV